MRSLPKSSQPQADNQAAQGFLRRLWPENILEDQWLLVWTLTESGTRRSQWYTDAEEVVIPGDRNVYLGVGLSPKNFGPHGRCPAEQIATLPGFWADVDFGEEGHQGGKAYPPDLATTLSIVESKFPPPSLIVYSGHGLQAWWLFDEPLEVDDGNRHHVRQATVAFHEVLKRRMGDYALDAVHDHARIMRIPGSVNVKGDEPKAVTWEDRGITYPGMDNLLDAVGLNTDNLPALTTDGVDLDPITPSAAISDSKLELLWDVFPDERRAWEGGAVKKDWDDSPSGRDWAAAKAAAMGKWTPEEVAALVILGREQRGDQPIRRDKLQATVAKAVTKADQPMASAQILQTLGVESVEERQELTIENELHKLSEALKLPADIDRITKTDQDPPEYTLHWNGRAVRLGDASGILDQRRFQRKMAEVSGIVIPMVANKNGLWDARAQIMLDNTETVEVGREGHTGSLVEAWVDDYLTECRLDTEMVETEDWQGAALRRLPFRREGRTWLSVQGDRGFLRAYVSYHGDRNMSSRQLAPILRGLGWEQGDLNFRNEAGKMVRRSYWRN